MMQWRLCERGLPLHEDYRNGKEAASDVKQQGGVRGAGLNGYCADNSKKAGKNGWYSVQLSGYAIFQ